MKTSNRQFEGGSGGMHPERRQKLETVKCDRLTAHPLSVKIYGKPNPFEELLTSIATHPAPRSTPELYLEVCSANDPRYQDIRSRHYVEKRGTHGQQVHFLVWYRGDCVGIISGASAVFGTLPRDMFFKITKANKKKCLNGIVDNVVYRLELNNEGNHLAGKILFLWEKSVAWVWENLYEVKVFGFETFIVKKGFMEEEVLDAVDNLGRPVRRVKIVPDPTGENIREGGTYRSVGWSLAGQSFGSTKGHDGVGLTGGQTGKGVSLRKEVPIKDVYCKFVPGFSDPVESEYHPTWLANTRQGTPEMKALAKQRTARRKALLGTRFYFEGKALVYENIEQATRGRIEWNAPRASAKTRNRKMRSSCGRPSERETLREAKSV